MALKQHHSLARNHRPADLDPGLIGTVVLLLLAVAATLGLRAIVSLDALAPLVVTVLFALAALAALVGLLLRQHRLQISMTDVAGILTFVGVGVSIAIEPDQMVRLMSWSDQTD